MSGNSLGVSGDHASLLKSLSNTKIKEIDLSDCEIGRGAKEQCEIIKQILLNKNITKVNLEGVDISRETFEEISQNVDSRKITNLRTPPPTVVPGMMSQLFRSVTGREL